MPSPKEPVEVVQPGPGRLPDGTVSATALTFPLGAGTNAALQAHITDPIGAHEDSAISTDAFGGLARWASPSGSVESTLNVVFNGLNARGVIVCDANPAATDADYAGPGALTAAYSLVPANNKYIIYLRPGVYTWADGAILSGVTIVGSGSPDTNFSTTQVEIQSSGNFRFANGAIVSNVLLTAVGTVQLPAGNGGCKFDNVAFKLTGSFVTSTSSRNSFTQCGTHVSSVTGTALQDDGGQNTFDRCNFEQITTTGIGGSSFKDVVVGSLLAPPFPASALVSAGAPNCSFSNLLITQGGPAITGPALGISSSNMSFDGLVIQAINTSAAAIHFTGGSQNSFRSVKIGGTFGSHVVHFFNSTENHVSGLWITGCTLSAPANVVDFSSSRNTIENLTMSSITGSSTNLISYNGVRNRVTGVYSLVSSSTTWANFAGTSSNCVLEQFNCQSTSNTVATALFNIQGLNNRLTGIELQSVSAMAVPIVRFNSAGSCEATGFRLSTVNVTAGAGFSIVSFVNSNNCKAGDFELDTSPLMGTTSGLLLFNGSAGCSFDGLRVNNCATTTAINSPILTATGSLNSRCVVRNLISQFTSYATGTVLLDVDQSLWEGLLLEKVNLQEQFDSGISLRLRQSGGALQATNLPITVLDCNFANANTAAGHGVFVNAFGGRAVIERCTIATSGLTSHSLRIDGSTNVAIVDCTVVAGGASTIAVSSTNSGARFTGCTFIGPGGGSSGTQLFNGWGFAGTSTFPSSPLVLQSCIMQLNTRNNSPSATTVPNVFLGGSGTTVAVGHGPIVVDGLSIAKGPGVTFTNWHRSPTLTIDVLNQAAGVESSFSNITIDLENIPFTGSGAGTSVFDPVTSLNGFGVIVEINGPGTSDPISSKTIVKGLSLLRLPRGGGGGRCAVLASGVVLQGLVIDAAAGSATNWGGSTLGVSNCVVVDADFYPTTSLPLGTGLGNFVLFAENNSRCDKVRMKNFAIAAAEQTGCAFLESSSLTKSFIHMQAGSHVPTGTGMIVLSGSANNDGCWLEGNKVTYLHYATSISDIRIVAQSFSTGARILNNRFINFAESSAASFSSVPANSNGGGCLIQIVAEDNVVQGNWIEFQWETDFQQCMSISSGESHTRIINNHTRNTATQAHGTDGGANGISVTGGLYHNISSNYVEGSNTNVSQLVRINTHTSGGSNIVMGNHVDNLAGTGFIQLHANDKPTPSGDYNFTT